MNGIAVHPWRRLKVTRMSRFEMEGLLEDHGIECYSCESRKDVELNLLYHLARGTVTFNGEADERLAP